MALVSGATGLTAAEMDGEEYRQRYAPRSPVRTPGQPMWVNTGTPGGALVDPHPGDVTDPGVYDPPPRPAESASLEDKSAWARECWRNGSPHTFTPVHCVNCRTQLGTHYGHERDRPPELRCAPCRGAA